MRDGARELFDHKAEINSASFTEDQTRAIAEHLDTTLASVKLVLELNYSTVGHDSPSAPDTFWAGVEDTKSFGEDNEDDDGFAAAEREGLLVGELQAMVAALPERDAGILSQRYGLASGEPMNVAETAKQWGMTRANVYLRIKAALRTLTDTGRQYLTSVCPEV